MQNAGVEELVCHVKIYSGGQIHLFDLRSVHVCLVLEQNPRRSLRSAPLIPIRPCGRALVFTSRCCDRRRMGRSTISLGRAHVVPEMGEQPKTCQPSHGHQSRRDTETNGDVSPAQIGFDGLIFGEIFHRGSKCAGSTKLSQAPWTIDRNNRHDRRGTSISMVESWRLRRLPFFGGPAHQRHCYAQGPAGTVDRTRKRFGHLSQSASGAPSCAWSLLWSITVAHIYVPQPSAGGVNKHRVYAVTHKNLLKDRV